MARTIEATIDEQGTVHLSEAVVLPATLRALVTILDEEPAVAPPEHADPRTLYDFLQGYAGTVEGTTEALSENTGQRFAEGMAEKYRAGKL